MVKIAINRTLLESLTVAMQEHTKTFEALDKAGAELTRRFGGWAGPSAEKSLAAERAKIETMRESARQTMRAFVESTKTAFSADIDRQTALAGAQIDAQDGELLRADLLTAPTNLHPS